MKRRRMPNACLRPVAVWGRSGSPGPSAFRNRQHALRGPLPAMRSPSRATPSASADRVVVAHGHLDGARTRTRGPQGPAGASSAASPVRQRRGGSRRRPSVVGRARGDRPQPKGVDLLHQRPSKRRRGGRIVRVTKPSRSSCRNVVRRALTARLTARYLIANGSAEPACLDAVIAARTIRWNRVPPLPTTG